MLPPRCAADTASLSVQPMAQSLLATVGCPLEEPLYLVLKFTLETFSSSFGGTYFALALGAIVDKLT